VTLNPAPPGSYYYYGSSLTSTAQGWQDLGADSDNPTQVRNATNVTTATGTGGFFMNGGTSWCKNFASSGPHYHAACLTVRDSNYGSGVPCVKTYWEGRCFALRDSEGLNSQFNYDGSPFTTLAEEELPTDPGDVIPVSPVPPELLGPAAIFVMAYNLVAGIVNLISDLTGGTPQVNGSLIYASFTDSRFFNERVRFKYLPINQQRFPGPRLDPYFLVPQGGRIYGPSPLDDRDENSYLRRFDKFVIRMRGINLSPDTQWYRPFVRNPSDFRIFNNEPAIFEYFVLNPGAPQFEIGAGDAFDVSWEFNIHPSVMSGENIMLTRTTPLTCRMQGISNTNLQMEHGQAVIQIQDVDLAAVDGLGNSWCDGCFWYMVNMNEGNRAASPGVYMHTWSEWHINRSQVYSNHGMIWVYPGSLPLME
jgi:hypothetical protein